MSGALVLQRGPLTQQPQYAAPINAAHRYAKNLTGYWLFNGSFRNCVNRQPSNSASIAGNPTFRAGVDGIYVSPDASSLVNTGYTATDLGINGATVRTTLIDYYSAGSGGGTLFALGTSDNGKVWRIIAGGNSISVSNYYADYSFTICPSVATCRVLAAVSLLPNGDMYFRTIARNLATGAEYRYSGAWTPSSVINTGDTNPLSFFNTSWDSKGQQTNPVYSVAVFSGVAFTDADIESFWRDRYQLLQAPRRRLWLAVNNSGTGAALSGAASAVASATGSLTTSIPLAASAAVVASASGALATQIPLAGSAAGLAAASGSLATQIRLAGSAGAVAATSGALTTQIALAGAASGAANASGALSTQIALSGSAAATSSAFGSLTAGTGLSGSASASASASGALATSIRLAGAASCSSSASGDLSTTPVGAALSGSATASANASGLLTTSIKLAGAAVAQASASGSLAGQAAALSGSAVCSSSSTGSLSTQIVVAGAAQAVASAVGSLTTAIRLGGAAACSSSATGALSTGLLPPEPNPHRMIVVQRRLRHFVARRRVRHFEVGR